MPVQRCSAVPANTTEPPDTQSRQAVRDVPALSCLLGHSSTTNFLILCTDMIKNNDFSLNFSPWKYIVNLAGTELPLYSVDDLSERLTVRPVKFSLLSYYERKYDVRFRYTWGLKKEKGKLIYSRLTRKPPPPFGLQVYKGTIHILRQH